MMRLLSLALGLLSLMSLPAAAQSPKWAGTYTPGHAVMQSSQGVISDAGPAAGSSTLGAKYLTELGITNTGSPFCISDALINAVGGYHQLCFGASALGGGLISFNAYGGATPTGLFFNINGTTYPFPTGGGTVVGPVTTVLGDVACWANTGGTLLNDCGPPSLFTRGSATKAVSYTAANADNGTTIYLNSAGIGGKTLTISALGSYSDSKYSVRACNTDTRVWTLASADGGNLKLYPKQCNAASSNGTALVYDRQFQRYNVTTGLLINVGPSGACNDANDGLGTGSGGAVCSGTVAFDIIRGEMQCQGGAVSIQLADGNYNQSFAMAGVHPPGCSDQVPIQGHSGVPTAVVVTAPTGDTAFNIQDQAISTVQNLSVVCTNANGFFARGGAATLDIFNVLTNDCAGGTIVGASDGGHVNVVGSPGLIVQGNAAVAFSSGGSGSLVSIPAGTVSVTNNPVTITNFLVASDLGYIRGGIFIGAGAVTGTRWVSANNSVISGYTTGGGCNFVIPGSINGSASTGGVCN